MPSANIRRPPSGFGGAPSSARRVLPAPRTIRPGRGGGPTRLRDFQGRYGAGGYGVSWTGIEASGEYLQGVADDITGGITAELIDQMTEQAVDRMKLQAPWEDDTGAAREGLQGNAMHSNDGVHRIFLGHTEEYGVHLEYGMGGRFQIIQPTLRWLGEVLGPAVAREIKGRI